MLYTIVDSNANSSVSKIQAKATYNRRSQNVIGLTRITYYKSKKQWILPVRLEHEQKSEYVHKLCDFGLAS